MTKAWQRKRYSTSEILRDFSCNENITANKYNHKLFEKNFATTHTCTVSVCMNDFQLDRSLEIITLHVIQKETREAPCSFTHIIKEKQPIGIGLVAAHLHHVGWLVGWRHHSQCIHK